MHLNKKDFVINKLKHATTIIKEASEELQNLNEDEVKEILSQQLFNELIISFLAPHQQEEEEDLFEYLVKYKNHLRFAPSVLKALVKRCVFRLERDGFKTIISPYPIQWIDKGVMFLEGFSPFSGGLRGYFPDRTIKVAITARDIAKGKEITLEDLKFLPIEDVPFINKTVPPHLITDLDTPLKQLIELLENRIEKESQYQSLLLTFPWILGAQYLRFISHKMFDDKNIPDFTALRVKDSTHDIYEIKQPFLQCFKQDGQLSGEFLAAWHQIVRYVDFAERESSYLERQKSIAVNNPKGYLIAGYNLSKDQRKQIEILERQHKNIQIMTYDDLIAYAKVTISWIKGLRTEAFR